MRDEQLLAPQRGARGTASRGYRGTTASMRTAAAVRAAARAAEVDGGGDVAARDGSRKRRRRAAADDEVPLPAAARLRNQPHGGGYVSPDNVGFGVLTPPLPSSPLLEVRMSAVPFLSSRCAL